MECLPDYKRAFEGHSEDGYAVGCPRIWSARKKRKEKKNYASRSAIETHISSTACMLLLSPNNRLPSQLSCLLAPFWHSPSHCKMWIADALTAFQVYYHTNSAHDLSKRFGDLLYKIQDLEVRMRNFVFIPEYMGCCSASHALLSNFWHSFSCITYWSTSQPVPGVRLCRFNIIPAQTGGQSLHVWCRMKMKQGMRGTDHESIRLSMHWSGKLEEMLALIMKA
eukprot:1156824-Pelagomonas_calceolata.AAC.3